MRSRIPRPRRGHRQQSVAPLRRASTPLPILGAVLVLMGAGVVGATAPGPSPVRLGQVPVTDMGSGTALLPPASGPMAMQMPSLDIAAQVQPVKRLRSGELDVPSSFVDVGWWGGTTEQPGPAPMVLVGHVDDHHGPAVFSRLSRAKPGQQVTVTGASRRLTYIVDAVRQYPDDAFPAPLVYGTTTRPTLRLITCGGFSWWRRHYEDNVVVFAHLLSVSPVRV